MITLTFETTEFNCLPSSINQNTVFMIFDNALVIRTVDIDGKTLTQTEIEMKDAIKLAKTILI